MRLLPPSLANAAASIQWPLGPEATPPLYLTSLENLRDTIRATDERASRFDFLQDLPATIEELFPTTSSSSSPEERHFGLISLALILLGNGWTDECHNLVTPLSWPDDIHFAYGPSVYSQVSPEARSYATYVHSLVHRREAFHVGEFGMLGFANANYWSNAFTRLPAVDVGFPHADLCAAVQGRAASQAHHAPIQSWYQQHHDFSKDYFEARAVHALCATVLQQQRENADPILQSFAEQVAETEVRILLDHTLTRAGFAPLPSTSLPHETLGSAATGTDASIDSDMATAAAQKVSSAHLDVFRSTGSIVLRRLAGSSNDDTIRSVAAGVACRLLEAPACRAWQPLDAADIVLQLRVMSDGESASMSVGGGDLAVGDVQVQCVSSSHAGKNKDIPVGVSYWVAANGADDAFWIDPFFGTRGESPTTVIQWSKGSIY